jgi:lipoprotein-anchoring transpeptidase ErfK/SrfK
VRRTDGDDDHRNSNNDDHRCNNDGGDDDRSNNDHGDDHQSRTDRPGTEEGREGGEQHGGRQGPPCTRPCRAHGLSAGLERAALPPARAVCTRGGSHTSTHRSLQVLVAALALLAAGSTTPASAHGARAPAVKPIQRLAALLRVHEVFSKPAATAARSGRVPARRPLTGERTVLPVLGAGRGWLRVRLPGRPNGHTGWIRRRKTIVVTTGWHIVVDTSRRRVIVYRRGRPVRSFKAVVGKPSTPTPRGEFFVEESIQLRATDVGAPFALALSARSNVLQEFAGGPGQIALHGLRNVGGVLGTAVSHGCVRLSNDGMRWLVVRIGPGVPVTITT